MIRLIFLGVALSVMGCSRPPGEREYERGVNDLRRGNAVGAKVQLERSIERRPAHPENAMAFNLLGMAAYQLGQYDEATDAFENSRRINPLLVEPVYNLGVLAETRGDLRTAARLFNDAALMDPEDTLAMEYLAYIYATRSQWMLARNALQTANERAPGVPRILTAMAEVERAMGHPETALDLLVRALEKNTRYAPALYNLAVLHETDLAHPDQARAYYQRYLSLSKDAEQIQAARQGLARLEGQPIPEAPPSPPATSSAPDRPGPTVSPEPEPPEERRTEQDRVLDAAEQLAREGQQPRAWVLFRRAADMAAEEGRPAEQGRILQRAGEACPEVPAAQTALGDLLLEQNQMTPALNAYRRALASEANFAPALVGEARVAIRQDDIDTALFILRQAVVADEGHPDAHWELARLYDQHTEQADNAARSYREFARIFPSDPRASNALTRATALAAVAVAPAPAPRPAPTTTPPPAPAPGLDYRPPTTRNTLAATRAIDRARQYQNRQDWERAIFFYLNALEKDDTIASIFSNLGFCYGQVGEIASARAAYLRAIELHPASVDSKYNLALLFQREGNLDQARRWMGEVLQEQPDNAQAHYAMGTILATSPATSAEARRHYQRFLELAPDDRAAPAVRRQLGIR